VVGTCKSHSFKNQHLIVCLNLIKLYLLKNAVGKLTRNEVMKDSVEIEALNETLSRPDTPNTSKESQLARLYYKNGKAPQVILIALRRLLDISQELSGRVDGLPEP
jgi:hypothetical protein